MAQFIDENVTVTITRMRKIDDLEGLGEGEADFFSTIDVDGKRFNGKKFEEDDDIFPASAWSFSNGASQLNGFVPLKIKVTEADTRTTDDIVDINPGAGNELNLFLDMNTNRVLNSQFQFLGNVGQTITLRGNNQGVRGEISFVVSGVAGLEPENSVFIQTPFVQDTPENNDRLGGGFFTGNNHVAVGDFNDDGRDDLIVGSPGEGIAHVSYGSTSGLSKTGTQTFANNAAIFAVGDINGDGADDLILGNSNFSATIRFGKAGSGLNNGENTINRSLIFPDPVLFSGSLAAGDFNGDGKDDVVTGDFLATVSGQFGSGAVQVNYGSAAGITNSGLQVFHRDTPGILGGASSGANFGSAPATGDLNGDGFEDLVVGASGASDTTAGAGVFHILYGSETGLRVANNQVIGQSFSGQTNQSGDRFGSSIAVGDVNGDRVADVIVGASGKNNGAGQVYVYHGRRGQPLSTVASRILTQPSLLGGTAEAGDNFGASLDARDINNDGFADVVIGAPGEDDRAGTVHVTFGSAVGVSSNVRILQQGSSGIAGTRETGDGFGDSVAIGNFDGSGSAEMAVSAPNESFGNVTSAGLVNIISSASITSFSLSTIESTRTGTNNSDILRGTATNGILDGKGGNDRILTGGGNDIAVGGVGNDILNAGAGDDLLYGGRGRDTQIGGTGRDVFVLARRQGLDLIQDFKIGKDFLGLANNLKFENLQFVQQGRNTLIQAGSDRIATLAGVKANSLTMNQFVQIGFASFENMLVPTVVS